jgi:hypothetical protein
MECSVNLNDLQSNVTKKQDFMKYFYDKNSSNTLNWGI